MAANGRNHTVLLGRWASFQPAFAQGCGVLGAKWWFQAALMVGGCVCAYCELECYSCPIVLARPPRAKCFVAKSEIWTKPVLLYYLYDLRLAALSKAVWDDYKHNTAKSPMPSNANRMGAGAAGWRSGQMAEMSSSLPSCSAICQRCAVSRRDRSLRCR